MKAREQSGRITPKITLKDKLSRLDLVRASRLLGPDGDALIREGGKREIDFDGVELTENRLTLTLADATVALYLDPAVRNRVGWSCSRCRSACEHVGAALSLVLEEKTALGLAVAPLMKTPIELLTDEQLVERALAERRERAASEPMALGLTDHAGPWCDHTVTTLNSGRTYRVALRGWERGQSYCSCPDFRKNTLGNLQAHPVRLGGDPKALSGGGPEPAVYPEGNIGGVALRREGRAPHASA